ncbi:hypothetical protein KJ781_00030 [Patescibacteria group bacterium]|nr:hypothetical protein [Patescibacteria group bacterium]MBU1448703.1 hypothetical protein [Patescibacteria group bacterium]MBU2613239.1 hypothetical protein [Patescibacteria group bacterium]
MDNVFIWIGIVVGSFVMGRLHLTSVVQQHGPGDIIQQKAYRLMDGWRLILGYFIGYTVVYYFLDIRWAHISQSLDWKASDFVLGLLALVGIFGWLSHAVRNVTEGINAIITRVLEK